MSEAVPEIAESAIPPDRQPAAIARWQDEIAQAQDEDAQTRAGRAASNNKQPAAGVDATRAPAKSTMDASLAYGYGYGRMLTYANTYWDNYNGNFRSYGGEGGECANFISQIGHSGGWTQVGSWPGDSRSDNSKWFYGGFTWTTSYSWDHGT